MSRKYDQLLKFKRDQERFDRLHAEALEQLGHLGSHVAGNDADSVDRGDDHIENEAQSIVQRLHAEFPDSVATPHAATTPRSTPTEHSNSQGSDAHRNNVELEDTVSLFSTSELVQEHTLAAHDSVSHMRATKGSNVGVKVQKNYVPSPMMIWMDMNQSCADIVLEWAGVELEKCEVNFALNPMDLYWCADARARLSPWRSLVTSELKAAMAKTIEKKEPKKTRETKESDVVKGGAPSLYVCAGQICDKCMYYGPIKTQQERAKYAAQLIVWDVLPKICQPVQC
eukprot:GFYU01015097.1.p1 GENE.GFYU01015097.1~~GFYU01015097.1.p1  ORF type:complete len:319 (+),score=51.56 GFYU01015097.1:107-958(+)